MHVWSSKDEPKVFYHFLSVKFLVKGTKILVQRLPHPMTYCWLTVISLIMFYQCAIVYIIMTKSKMSNLVFSHFCFTSVRSPLGVYVNNVFFHIRFRYVFHNRCKCTIRFPFNRDWSSAETVYFISLAPQQFGETGFRSRRNKSFVYKKQTRALQMHTPVRGSCGNHNKINIKHKLSKYR